MGTKECPAPNDCFHIALPGEKTFTLLARDPAAPDIVEAWVDCREQLNPVEHESEQLREARDCARQMRDWRRENFRDGNPTWRSRTTYCCGFIFNNAEDRVLLVRKQSGPNEIAGKFNGIGGRLESGESPLMAMQRETAEETGLEVDWQPLASYSLPYAMVWFFYGHLEFGSRIRGLSKADNGERFHYLDPSMFGASEASAAPEMASGVLTLIALALDRTLAKPVAIVRADP